MANWSSFPAHAHDHDHDHEGGAVPHTHLTSVGIDIGSSTSHLMFSQLTVGFPSVHQRRPEVLNRTILSRSPVTLTPFLADWNIDSGPLKELVDAAFADAGLRPEAIDTGAVIVTGEAARRDNAQRIAELFSDEAGRFVCATAGPRLEAVLAAHGSGAVGRSRDEGSTLLHVDVGGGTTKVNVIVRGVVVATTALNIGARLVAFDDGERLVRIEKAGERFLRLAGLGVGLSDEIRAGDRALVADRMANALFESLAGGEPPWSDLLVTAPLRVPEAVDRVLFSGGVSEYIYGREAAGFGDLGPFLGAALKAQAKERGYTILDAAEGIRATVIGASEYSIQLSGETIFLPDVSQLPVRNLRTFAVHVEWGPGVANEAEEAVRRTILDRDPEVVGAPFALLVSTPPFSGYGVAQELAKGIGSGLRGLTAEQIPQILVFEQNIGQVVGRTLAAEISVPCIDEVQLSELDFIDVGEPVPGESYVPVVVKSLAFGA